MSCRVRSPCSSWALPSQIVRSAVCRLWERGCTSAGRRPWDTATRRSASSWGTSGRRSNRNRKCRRHFATWDTCCPAGRRTTQGQELFLEVEETDVRSTLLWLILFYESTTKDYFFSFLDTWNQDLWIRLRLSVEMANAHNATNTKMQYPFFIRQPHTLYSQLSINGCIHYVVISSDRIKVDLFIKIQPQLPNTHLSNVRWGAGETRQMNAHLYGHI